METKEQLKIFYTKFLKHELPMRERMEKSLSIQKKAILKNSSSANLKGYNVYKIMDNRQDVVEDAHQCKFCTDFTYVSMIFCSKHKYQYCLHHDIMCGCAVPALQLVYRYSTEELQSY
mmetsp:Transcript_52821/g.72353  ORF Transcript_52821/g.72353 Transcript_52821/m.72353 type:complete len:118 (+) Transcript_52821:1416-1769(+)